MTRNTIIVSGIIVLPPYIAFHILVFENTAWGSHRRDFEEH
jgi:hypothetical protein